MKKFLKGLWSFLQVLIVVYVVLVTIFLLFRNKYGYTEIFNVTFVSVDSVDSKNIKGTKNGDLIIVYENKQYKRGDFIYYYSVLDEDFIVKGGLIGEVVEAGNEKNSVVGKDRNIVLEERVLGKKAVRVPNLGRVIDVITGRIGFLLLVLFPIIVVFVYQLFQFIVVIKSRDDENIDYKKKSKKNKHIEKSKS